MNAGEIAAALTASMQKGHECFREVKDGPSYRRGFLKMDFLAIRHSWTPVEFKGYEIKVSRQDFLQDKKWPQYMQLCHRFYWACPTGLIDKSEIDPQAGLVYVNEKTGRVHTRKAAPFRDIEPDWQMLLYLLLWRSEGSNQGLTPIQRRTAAMTAVKLDMAAREQIGQGYRHWISKSLRKADHEIKQERSRLRAQADQVRAIITALDDLPGISQYMAADLLKSLKGASRLSLNLRDLKRAENLVVVVAEQMTNLVADVQALATIQRPAEAGREEQG